MKRQVGTTLTDLLIDYKLTKVDHRSTKIEHLK